MSLCQVKTEEQVNIQVNSRTAKLIEHKRIRIEGE
jgi:hypothetical protein